MLAQNFKTAADLEIRDDDQAALVQVLGMLERGEIDKDHFDMSEVLETACGTVGCLCGWAYTVSHGQAFPEVAEYERGNDLPYDMWPKKLQELFALRHFPGIPPTFIKPEQAATALRNYLTAGDANWREVLAASA